MLNAPERPNLNSSAMRYTALCLSTMLLLAYGCGPSHTPSVAMVNPAQEADRVLAIAADLEKQGKTKQAFAAYRQVVTNFPGTPSGKLALAIVKKAQSRSPTKAKKAKK
jgi:hypothetical protein